MSINSDQVVIFDTTCRDGNQTPGVNLSVEEKTLISLWLDYMGAAYVEGGWPGANPTDSAFFEKLPVLKQAKLVAFGMTHKRGALPQDDGPFRKVVESAAPVVCLVGKSWEDHVTGALGATLDENLEMIRNSVAFAKKPPLNKEVVFDAEHFFDGYKKNKRYTLECLRTAYEAGADWLVLCDTNGGTMTEEVEEIVRAVAAELPGAKLGIHCHNDCGLAVANSLAAVRAGCRMVQGTMNGLGERCGNANLMTLLPILKLKYGYDVGVSEEKLQELKALSDEFYELLEQSRNDSDPFVGDNAFAHKGGLHTAAVKKDPGLYEHTAPESVGNKRRFPVSDQSGLSSILLRLREMGIDVADKDPLLHGLLESVKRRKRKGYTYDHAAASLAVLALRKLNRMPDSFTVQHFKADVEGKMNGHETLLSQSEASVDMKIGSEKVHRKAKGLGPVHALDRAMRKTLVRHYPELGNVELDDFKVRILSPDKATGATTEVHIVMKDRKTGALWTTIGVSQDIVGASLEALVDGYNYRLTVGKMTVPEPEPPSVFMRSRLELWSTGKAPQLLAT